MKGRGLGPGFAGNRTCEKVAGSQSSGQLVEQAAGVASRRGSKGRYGEKERPAWRRKVAEQRMWGGS